MSAASPAPFSIVPVAPPEPQPEPTTAPPKELEPFVLKPRTEPVCQENWDYEDAPSFGFVRILWENAKFFTRLLLPYAVVIGLAVYGFVYRNELRTSVKELHAKLVSEMRPKPADLNAGSIDDDVDPDEYLGPGLSGLTGDNDDSKSEPADDGSMNVDAAARAIEAHVSINVPGSGSGSGVVCSMMGKHALILTNKSLVDHLYWVTNGDRQPNDLPPVKLAYSNGTEVSGEVVWVADGLINLAIIKAECLSTSMKAISWRPPAVPVREGDPVFYVDPGGKRTSEQVARATVTEVAKHAAGNSSVPIVKVSASQIPVGTALYNRQGELVAIHSPAVSPGSDTMALQVSVLETLQPAALLTQ